MRYTLLLILSLTVSVASFGQKNQKTGKPIKKDNLLIDVHYSTMFDRPTNVTFDYGHGASFQLFYDYQFKAKVLSGAIGIAYSNDNYYNNSLLTNSDTINGDYASFTPFSSLDSSYKRNKYATNYFDIPVELRFRSKPNYKGHSWKAAIGFRVGFRLGSHTRTINDDKERYQSYNFTNLRKQRYGLTARFGYGRMGLVGYYSLTTLFEDNSGQVMSPWSVGFTISPW
ncbi:MAG: outer membrane beta-barrel protein [Salibacteraceae bacterium]